MADDGQQKSGSETEKVLRDALSMARKKRTRAHLRERHRVKTYEKRYTVAERRAEVGVLSVKLR